MDDCCLVFLEGFQFFFADTSQNEFATTHAMFTLFEYNAITIDALGASLSADFLLPSVSETA